MPGPVEEAGEVARTTVHALSTTPALLALILMQLVMLGVIVYGYHERNIYETRLNELLVSMCREKIRAEPHASLTTCPFDAGLPSP